MDVYLEQPPMNFRIYQWTSKTATKVLVDPGLALMPYIIGFLRGGCPKGGGNWGTLRIPREDLGTLGNIRED